MSWNRNNLLTIAFCFPQRFIIGQRYRGFSECSLAQSLAKISMIQAEHSGIKGGTVVRLWEVPYFSLWYCAIVFWQD